MQSTATRPIVTLEHLRSQMGTDTYDAIARERAITDARLAAAKRLAASVMPAGESGRLEVGS